jgi:hypothetical protein
MSLNLRIVVRPNPVARAATHSEYQPIPSALKPARLTIPT